MSKIIRCNVDFGFKMVFNTEALNTLADNRADARAVLAKAEADGVPLTGQHAYVIRLFASDASDEAVLEGIMRASIRQFIREDVKRELCGDGQRATMGNVKVSFKEPMVSRKACGLHDSSKACTALCKRFEVTV